jgi:hypothetical protein
MKPPDKLGIDAAFLLDREPHMAARGDRLMRYRVPGTGNGVPPSGTRCDLNCDPSAYARSSSGMPENLVQFSAFAVVRELLVITGFPKRADQRIAALGRWTRR